MKTVKITCDQCGESKEKTVKQLETESDGMSQLVIGMKKSSFHFTDIGRTTVDFCEACGVKAENELREFLRDSKYFTEDDPF